MEWFVRTADGRTLAVEDAGDRAGRPVLVHVGTPNSRHLYGRTVADATARGLRLVSHKLRLVGVADLVEFHPDPTGGPEHYEQNLAPAFASSPGPAQPARVAASFQPRSTASAMPVLAPWPPAG